MAFIYLLNESNTDAYKIGVTKSDITKRKASLQTGNSKSIILCRYFQTEYPYKVEKLLHKHFSVTRLSGEWFTLTDKQAMDFLKVCDKYQNIVEYMITNNEFYK